MLAPSSRVIELDLPDVVTRALADPNNESPKPNDPVFATTEFKLIARPADAFRAAEREARKLGYEPVMLGDRIEGEARDVAAEHAGPRAGAAKARPPRGHPVRRRTDGHHPRPGPGRAEPGIRPGAGHCARGAPGIAALAGDTDGTDGGAGSADDPAGAVIDQTTLARARSLGLDPAHFLSDNDSTGFFSRLGDLVETGPTWTNVNDFRAIVVDRP